MTTREQIVSEARQWISTPFHHQARLKGVGVDCVGVVIGVARALGLIAPDFDIPPYSRHPDGTSLLQTADMHMRRIQRDEMQPGDVVVVRWGRDPQHLGILTDYWHGGLAWVHAFGTPDGKGKVIEQRFDLSVMVSGGSFVAAYALPGVN